MAIIDFMGVYITGMLLERRATYISIGKGPCRLGAFPNVPLGTSQARTTSPCAGRLIKHTMKVYELILNAIWDAHMCPAVQMLIRIRRARFERYHTVREPSNMITTVLW